MIRRGLPVLAALCLATLLPLSAAAQTVLPPLEAPATVFFDGDAIPHVCTVTERDAFVLQGYLHARDRFFQMDTSRRLFSGTLAELVGPGALPSDVQLRTLGLRRAAERSLPAYQQLAAGGSPIVEYLEAYAAGVNTYLAGNPLPPEYQALELTSVPEWTVIDSLTVGKGLAFGLSFDLLEIELTPALLAYLQVGQAAGFNGAALFFEDLFRVAPFDDRVSLPGGQPPFDAAAGEALRTELARPDVARLQTRAADLARAWREEILEVPELAQALEPRGSDTGSNWWVLSGEKTTTGHPMLANDPHLALNTPATFYEIHLMTANQPGCGVTPSPSLLRFVPATPERTAAPPQPVILSLNVNGVSFAGAPGVVQGCNDRICWGSTVNPMDVTDVYLEELAIDPGSGVPVGTRFEDTVEPVTLIPQLFRVNQAGDGTADNLADAGIGPAEGGLTIVVPRRNHGPIVSIDTSTFPVTALSVQYTGWGPTLEFEAFRRFAEAGTVEEFREGVQFFDVGSQNWAYADVDGNIAYFTSAEMPLREDLQLLMAADGGVPPFLIRDGTHELAHEWLAVENPQPHQVLPYEILPFPEMPQAVNPAKGWIANANNDPIGTSLDNNPLNQPRPGGGLYYLSPGYSSLRMGRIDRVLEALLAGDGKASLEDLKDLQANHELLDAELIAPFLIAAFDAADGTGAPAELAALADDPGVAEAIGRLRAWDWSTPTGIEEGYDPGDDPDDLPAPSAQEVARSIAATLWAAFRGQLIENVIDETLAGVGVPAAFLPGGREGYKAVDHLLATFPVRGGIGVSGVDFFAGSPGLTREQSRDLALLESLREALDLLASDAFEPAFGGSGDQDDYRWGLLHRIVFDHPLGGPFNVPPAAGFDHVAPLLPGVARSGGYEAVDASSHNPRADGLHEFMFGSGPNRRFVGELGPAGIDAEQVIPGGQVGVLGSPHYASQLGRWLTNHYHPLLLDPDAVAAATVADQPFGPRGEPSCVPSPTVLCLHDGRFRVQLAWETPQGTSGVGTVAVQSDDSGVLTFFNPDNWEMLVKVLEGCVINDHYWVFAAAATNVGWELVVEDTVAGETRIYTNPVRQPSRTVTDVAAFATCP